MKDSNMESFNEYIAEYRKQMEKGAIQIFTLYPHQPSIYIRD
jgi:hypothetical protein